jgi:hypothetical protein
VVDVAGKVAARRAVDGNAAARVKEVKAVALILFFFAEPLAGVLDHARTARDGGEYKKPEARDGALNGKRYGDRRKFFISARHMNDSIKRALLSLRAALHPNIMTPRDIRN